jgi:tetratricopeptide (TPR) repeat protein
MEGSAQPARSGRGLALTFVDGRAVLALQGGALPSLGRADRLELEIPAVRFAFDLSGGVSGLASRRCRLRELALSAGWTEVAGFLRGGRLADSGIIDPTITVVGGELRVEAQARLGRHEACFTVRVAVRPVHPRRVRISLYDVRVYGFFPVSAPMLASALLTPSGAVPRARPVASRGGVPAAAPLLWLDGPTDLELELVELALLELLPGQGWRMPERGQVRAVPAHGEEGRVALRYAWSEVGGEEACCASALDDYDQSRQRHAKAEDALGAGEIGSAAASYRRARPVAAGDPWACTRLLQLLSAGASTTAEAVGLAMDALARWPDFIPARLARAAAASEAGQPAEAARLYQQVADLSTPPARVGSSHALDTPETIETSDTIDQACALVAVARERQRAGDGMAAMAALEQALAVCPRHRGAYRALVQRLTAEARWSDLVHVIIQRAADEEDLAARAALHAEAGFVHLDRLGDGTRARDCFEQALRLAPEEPTGRDGLARLDAR